MLLSDVVRDYAEFMRHERNYTERTCLAYGSWISTFQPPRSDYRDGQPGALPISYTHSIAGEH